MTVGCVGVPPWCFYLDDPDRGWGFETLVARELPAALNGRYELEPRPALLGISMGGYGALKIAFRHPESWRAVAAIAPMIEPSLDADGASLRNRFHYPPQCPGPLVGPDRDGALYERNHPAALARANAGPLRESQLPIWFDAGSRDSVHAHDGAEFLHRTLWDLDILHEYRLHRDADHIGPLLPARLVEAFGWIGRQLASPNLSPTPEQVALHEALADARAEAARADPTVLRHYGRL
jgi:S-formylglutathione hydrolase